MINDNPLEIRLFQRLVDDFAEAFYLDQTLGAGNTGSAVEGLQAICEEDGIPGQRIRLARKVGETSFIVNGVKPI